MKKNKFFLLFLIISFITNAQNNTANIDLSFGSKFSGYTIENITVQPDGKILVGGTFTSFNGTTQNRLIRLNTDGTKDTSFNIGTGFPAQIYSIVIQPDNKILVGGLFTTFNGQSQKRIIRLNTDGKRDTFFNTGTLFDSPSSSQDIRSIALQPDGKILAGGNFTTTDGVSNFIRLSANGFKDTSFNIGTGFSTSNSIVYSVALQLDGKILVGGYFDKFNGTTQKCIIRLNADGTKDTTFDIGTGFDGSVNSIVAQSDGKILAGGEFTTFNGVTQSRLIRLNADGSKDTSFNIGTGFNNVGGGGSIYSIALQPNGKILVGGNFNMFNGLLQHSLILLNTDGSKDIIFDIGDGFYNSVLAITLQPDSKIWVGGAFATYNETESNLLIRLRGDNALATDSYVRNSAMIFPNATSDFINVTGFELEPNENAIIINLNGQVIKSLKINKDRIDVSDLKTGIYFVKIKNIFSKFIKK
jgi:uncharacterized delta-60 repeat protein